MTTPAIKISDVSIGYKKGKTNIPVHENIMLEARKGEVIALIGENGIGKSTLLKTLMGFLPSLAGSIFIKGENMHQLSRKQLAKTISFVSTEMISANHLKATELVSLGRHPFTNWLGINTAEDNRVVEDALNLVGASHFAHRPVNELSDGERQRVMIARALAQDTPIILLDEPTAFLDLPNKYEVFHLLVQLSREKEKTVVLSSHDLNIALAEVDKIWLMQEKTIIEGSPEDLVLSNKLNEFLRKSKVTFHPEEGAFKIRRIGMFDIEVQGEGIQYIWTVKSMERTGFNIKDNAPRWMVSCINNKWRLTDKQTQHSFNFETIYDLNLHLKTKTNSYERRT